MPRASETTSVASAARAMMHVASPPSVMTSSALATRRPSLPNSSSSRSVATMSAVHRVDDLASSDELKVYKDEGDADDENKSSAENLDEEKRGLLTETEQVDKQVEMKTRDLYRLTSAYICGVNAFRSRIVKILHGRMTFPSQKFIIQNRCITISV